MELTSKVFFNDLVQVEKNRFFIDIAHEGCGSGCKYCYVKTARAPQVLATYDELLKLFDLMQGNALDGDIFSFCPNTEPFKSSSSINRVLFLVDLLTRNDCYVQISTKESIPNYVLESFDGMLTDRSLFLNISIPFLDIDEIEPNAGSVESRINNMIRIHQYTHLKCGLYIKPFTERAKDNISRYNELIELTNPDYVCVGFLHNSNIENACRTLYKEEERNYINDQIHDMIKFTNELHIKKEKICFSSVCAIYKEYDLDCDLYLERINKKLCENCHVKTKKSGSKLP